MTAPKTTLDPNRSSFRISSPNDGLYPGRPMYQIVGPEDFLDITEPSPHLQTLELSWTVLNLATVAVREFEGDGGHFISFPGWRYLIVLRASDVNGIQRITLDGAGDCRCASLPDQHGSSYEAVLPLSVSIAHAAFSNTGTAPTLQDLIVVMNPDIGAFQFDRLSGGIHHYNGTSGPREYFAVSGLFRFSATAANSLGHTLMASLTTSA